MDWSKSTSFRSHTQKIYPYILRLTFRHFPTFSSIRFTISLPTSNPPTPLLAATLKLPSNTVIVFSIPEPGDLSSVSGPKTNSPVDTLNWHLSPNQSQTQTQPWALTICYLILSLWQTCSFPPVSTSPSVLPPKHISAFICLATNLEITHRKIPHLLDLSAFQSLNPRWVPLFTFSASTSRTLTLQRKFWNKAGQSPL